MKEFVDKLRERLEDEIRKNYKESIDERDIYKIKELEGFANAMRKVVENINQLVEEYNHKPQTRIDRIRSMSAEELADAIMKNDTIAVEIDFCQRFEDCQENIPESECRKCLIQWLNSKE